MATFMFIGITTTLIINEPKNNFNFEKKYSLSVYIKFFLVFLIAIIGFVGVFLLSAKIANSIKSERKPVTNNDYLSNFRIEVLRLIGAFCAALLIIILAVNIEIINKGIFAECYLSPIKDCFERYTL
jgi:hypothetical protein